MNIPNKKIRIVFIAIITAAIIFMLYFNLSGIAGTQDYSSKLNVISLIFFTALIFLLYIIFEAYKVMYDEMTERVNTITANKDDLQTVYNSIFLLLIEVDKDSRIINVNDYVCTYLNRKRNHILGKTISKVFSMEPEVIKKIDEMIDSAFQQKKKIFDEFETGGSIFEASTSVLQDLPDTEKKVLLVLNDVTQERANYKQMMQDNKMIAVGQLAAGVAHEIRNPLGLIRTYSHLLKKNPDDDEVREQAIPMIDYAVDRSSGIIDNLLGFSRLSDDKWENISLSKTLDSVLMLEEHESQNRNVQIFVNCPDDLTVYTISESLQIILINLINNSIDAMDDGGNIYINCSRVSDDVVITVRDTGTGIPEDIVSDIFNPFFTTKGNTNGSGLGLYIVYNEVLKLGGKIEVDSKSGEGTTFTLTLKGSKANE